MLCVPVPITLGVYVDVHVAGLLALSVHAVSVSVPVLVGAIVPPGGLLVPVSVSVTVTAQVVESFTGIDPDAQLTPVVVVRGRTVSAKAVVVLLPASIDEVAAEVDTTLLQSRSMTLGRQVVWQLVTFREALPNGHAVNVPFLLLMIRRPPRSTLLPYTTLSRSVTAQVVESFTGIDPDAQLTPVVVVRGRTVSAKPEALLLLVAWIES